MTSSLIGRDVEVADLWAAVRDGSGALVSGEPGVGKTALAHALAHRVARSGERVEWIVATAASRPMPFGALAPLLPDDLATLHPALVLGALARHLRASGGRRPPLIVVEDAHLLDDASAATVLGLVTAGAARVLVTVREGHPAPDAVRSLWKDAFLPSTTIAPFDRDTTRAFLAALLGGQVATATAGLLWHHTRGNALYLSELAREERARGRLVDNGGVWMWRGGLSVPPRLADLLGRRFGELSDAGLDALGALVLGEPLPCETLTGIVAAGAIAELEDRGLVEATERGGLCWYQFVHPLLASAAAEQLTPTRRRRLADALMAASRQGVDVVRRATWLLDASGPVEPEPLVKAAWAVLLTQPELARRFAERALPHDEGPAAALVLADAHAELGRPAAARQAHTLAATAVRTSEERLAVALGDLSLITFSERCPDRARAEIDRLRVALPVEHHSDLDSAAALVALFAARPADALAQADRVLAGTPTRTARLRATSARIGALALVDRSSEALPLIETHHADVAAGPTSPYTQGMAHIVAGLARFVAWDAQYAPATDPSAGPWPIPPSDEAVDRRVDTIAFPLFTGGRLLFEGDVAHAVPPLREAMAQQRLGEGLLRSEAAALLVVALAASGDLEGATRLLETEPPDALAVYPGLELWARATVEAVAGRARAIDLALAAAEQARQAGATVSVVAYLAEASRFGAAAQAAQVLDSVGPRFDAAITVARAVAIRARASGDGKELLEAAERHAEIGLTAGAAELAELAAAALGRDRSDACRHAQQLALRMRRRLGKGEPDRAEAPVLPLTRRELEVARLAAKGMSDREISSVLVVSVRTVESHLASTYRKLAITSRQNLRGALAVAP